MDESMAARRAARAAERPPRRRLCSALRARAPPPARRTPARPPARARPAPAACQRASERPTDLVPAAGGARPLKAAQQLSRNGQMVGVWQSGCPAIRQGRKKKSRISCKRSLTPSASVRASQLSHGGCTCAEGRRSVGVQRSSEAGKRRKKRKNLVSEGVGAGGAHSCVRLLAAGRGGGRDHSLRGWRRRRQGARGGGETPPRGGGCCVLRQLRVHPQEKQPACLSVRTCGAGGGGERGIAGWWIALCTLACLRDVVVPRPWPWLVTRGAAL